MRDRLGELTADVRRAIHLRVHAQSQPVEADEAGGVVLVVGLRGVGFHGGDVGVVHAELALAASGVDAAFVQLHADGAGDVLLALGDEGLEGEALRGVPEAVVHELGVLRDEAVAQVHDFAVHGEGLDLAMGEVQDGTAGGLIHTAALHADEAVFHHVHAAHAVFAAEFVQRFHDLEGIHGLAVHGHAVAFVKVEHDVLGFVRGVFREDGEGGEVVAILHIAGVEPRVFQNAGLIADVQEVAVHGEGLFRARLDGDLFLFAVGDHFGTARELGAETLVTPGGDDLEVRGESGGGELEADLVVAFAGGAVADGGGAFELGDLDHALGDEGAGDGGAQEVLAFIDGPGLHHGEDEVLGEFFLEVVHVDFQSAGLFGFGVQAFQFVVLTDVGAKGDDFGIIGFFDPGEQDGGVEAAGISEDDFLFHVWERERGE